MRSSLLLALTALTRPSALRVSGWAALVSKPAATPVSLRMRRCCTPSMQQRQPQPSSAAGGEINVDGLRKEAQRVLYRAQKKYSKAAERVMACEEQENALLAKSDATLEELEALPNCEARRVDAAAAQERLAELEDLVSGLQNVTREGADSMAIDGLIALATKLGVNDHPPARPPPKPRKPKGVHASKGPRLPYRVFRSEDGAEIRVGKAAADNDVLSTDPQHRDGDDWWLHAAGCPGSHVPMLGPSPRATAVLVSSPPPLLPAPSLVSASSRALYRSSYEPTPWVVARRYLGKSSLTRPCSLPITPRRPRWAPSVSPCAERARSASRSAPSPALCSCAAM